MLIEVTHWFHYAVYTQTSTCTLAPTKVQEYEIYICSAVLDKANIPGDASAGQLAEFPALPCFSSLANTRQRVLPEVNM